MKSAVRKNAVLKPRSRDGRTFASGPMAQIGDHSQLGDEALVSAIGQQDPGALAEAYARHGSQVHAIARGLCGEGRAEELTKEIFLQLWNQPQQFNTEGGSLRSHLLMRTHGRAVDILRCEKTPAVAGSQHPQAKPDRLDVATLALSLLERAEIDELVAALPVDERHPIVLAYFGGHTYSQVARLLGVSEGDIKTRIRSGLTRLRTIAPSSST